MTAVGFEPTQLALVELESTPLDHSGKLSLAKCIRILMASHVRSRVSGEVVNCSEAAGTTYAAQRLAAITRAPLRT